MVDSLQKLALRLRGTVEFDVPLARYTTYRIGGPAAALVIPESTEDVVEVLKFCNDAAIPSLALGHGSNVLVSDAGFAGVVVRVGKGMDWLEEGVDGPEVWQAGAGVPTPRLARITARAGLSGIQRLIGVPGTVGGGVVMNAGAHRQNFSQTVRSVEIVDSDWKVRTIAGSEIQWRYRSSGIENAIVTAATFEFGRADPNVLERDIQRHFEWRRKGTPFDEPCCGSVFLNPQGAGQHSAGQLIDAAGLKGFRVGAAQVSQKHANYIVNLGGATASDVKAVIDGVRERVLAGFGVELQLEVRLIGDEEQA
ncbi:MAG: UDP-N-acetylmuramate dehydrogenase [Gemmatimonadota bacterium]|nr:MAG: UDP-N-acetylmuramate dehydrogenase [Gemmatimonadota bacterium]